MIKFENVTFRYPYDAYNVLENLTMTLPNGINTVLCDMQSGKTTICKLIVGNVTAQSGTVSVDDVSVSQISKKVSDVLYLPQKPTFFENRSVLFNLQYPLKVRKLLATEGDKVQQLAQQFEIVPLLKQKPKKLTAEQRKLVALVRGLTVCRKIVLFDGFFDDTISGESSILNIENVTKHFDGTVVILTDKKQLATGNTVVLDGGACIFSGDSEQAKQVVNDLTWLADRV